MRQVGGGPFLVPLLHSLLVLPLDIVSKKVSGEYVLIYHLLHQKGASVNNAIIASELCSIQYASSCRSCS